MATEPPHEPVDSPSRSTPARASADRRERYGLLLGALIVVFAIQGIAEPAAWEQVAVTFLLVTTFQLALRIADVKPAWRRLVLAPLLLAMAISVAQALNGNTDAGATRIANAVLVGLAPPAVILGVVRSVRAKQAITYEAVLGVLCVYLLLGMFFAFVYGAIDRLGGAPFFAQEASATVSRCLYFSFTTLTTVGYGDLTARSNLGHTLSVTEALVGQIYLVTIVSLFVSNMGRSRRLG